MPVWRLQHRDTGRRDRQRVNRPTCRAKPTLHRRIVDRIFDLGRRFDGKGSQHGIKQHPARKLSRASLMQASAKQPSKLCYRGGRLLLDWMYLLQSFGRVGEQISSQVASRCADLPPCARSHIGTLQALRPRLRRRDGGYGRRRNGNRCCRARRIFLPTSSPAPMARSARPQPKEAPEPVCVAKSSCPNARSHPMRCVPANADIRFRYSCTRQPVSAAGQPMGPAHCARECWRSASP